MAGPFIRVGDALLNIPAVQAVSPCRHDTGWATVTLTGGRTVDVHRSAGELISDIQTILRDGHGRREGVPG